METPEKIRTWEGAARVAEIMAQRGFLLPTRYAEFTAGLVGKSIEAWRRELFNFSCEYLRFNGKLDRTKEIGAALSSAENEIVMNVPLRDRFMSLERQWKAAEVIPDADLEQGWSEKKIHLRHVAQRVAQAEGFRKTAKGYDLDLPGELRLDVVIDAGHPGSTIPQIVMINQLVARDRSWKMWLPWQMMLPGFDCYDHGDDRATMVWGIKAHVTIGKAFASTLD